MDMKRNPERMLKIAGVIAGLIGLALGGWYIPMRIGWACERYPELSKIYWPGMICDGGVLLMCLLALWQFWKICTEIGRDNSFSQQNVRALNIIGWLMLGIAALLALCLAMIVGSGFISLFIIACLLFWTVVFVLAAMLATALSNLVRRAAETRGEENLPL